MIKIAVILLGLMLLSGCSEKKPVIDYDPGFAVEPLHTFIITDTNVPNISSITEQRIRNALKKVLVAKGYNEGKNGADFTVSYQVNIMKDVPSNVSIGFGFGTGGPHTGIGVGASKQLKHDEAMLEIQMHDTQQNHIFWTASYRTRLDNDAAPQERNARINDTVAGMLESFPKAQK